MFTGLVEQTSEILRIESARAGRRLFVDNPFGAEGLSPGDSVAVDGACVTVENCDESSFRVHLSAETLNKTALDRRNQADRVHLERSLRWGDRIGGHFVSGHVDATGRVESVESDGDNLLVRFSVPDSIYRYLIEKGSIAVDGVSLTINRITEAGFAATLVPHTLQRTHFDDLNEAQTVNIEADLLIKGLDELGDEEQLHPDRALDELRRALNLS